MSLSKDDILSLMAGMASNRIGALEFEGLKLVSKADDRPMGSAVSSIGLPPGPPGPVPTMPSHVGVVRPPVQAPVVPIPNKVKELARKEQELARKARLRRGPLTQAVTKLVEAAKEPGPPEFKPLTPEDL